MIWSFRTIVDLGGENFIAFVIRLNKICWTRISSTLTKWPEFGPEYLMCILLCLIYVSMILTVSLSRSTKDILEYLGWILRRSISDLSSSSLTVQWTIFDVLYINSACLINVWLSGLPRIRFSAKRVMQRSGVTSS